jgi:WD40 repeat protein/uncharacterized caspase-like protein
MGHAQKVNQIEVSFDFVHLASVDDSNIIHIWDTKSKREIYQLKSHSVGISSIAFNPKKAEFASADISGKVIIWDYINSKILKTFETKESGTKIHYLNSGDKIASIGGATISVWNTTSGQLIKSLNLQESLKAVDVSIFSGHIAVGSSNGQLTVLDENLNTVFTFSDYAKEITAITYFSKKDKALIGYIDGTINLVNIDKERLGENKKIFNGNVGNILIDSKVQNIIAVGNDESGYVKFLKPTLDESTTRFKWSSIPKDKLGLRAMAWKDTTETMFYIADHDNVIREWDMAKEDWTEQIFKGTARPIYDIDVDGAGQKLIIGSRQTQIKVYDLTGATPPVLLEGHDGGVIQLDYHPDKNLVVAADREGEIKIWNTVQRELKERIKKAEFLDYNIQFTGAKSILRKVGESKFELSSFLDKETKSLSVAGASDFKISPDGSNVVFKRVSDLSIYKSTDLTFSASIPASQVNDFTFVQERIVVLEGDGKVSFYEGNIKSKDVVTNSKHNRICGFRNGEFVLFSSEGTNSNNYAITVFDASGKSMGDLEGHSDYVTNVIEINSNLLSSSLDGSIKIWGKTDGKYVLKGTIIPLRKEGFVITTPDQLFDASYEAMMEMHYTRGKDIIALEQLKDTYYEPNLLPKLLGFSSGQIRKPLDISKLGIYPDLKITHPNLNNGKLGIEVTNKGGGIGRVVLVINGKEVANDVRKIKDGDLPTMGIEYDIQGHPYMYPDKVNKITIKAYNKDGTLGSEPQNILVLPSGNKGDVTKPKIFALVIGSSDYANDDLDLKYAAKDAQDFAAALKMSSTNLIGGENIKMTTLTTSKEKSEWPTKENIKKVFEQYSKEASARDYLIVYMAGHGVNSGGENGDFYYLTCTATDGKINNEKTRLNDAISSAEFTEYIKKVPALKQVMIVDACHSGTLTSSFGKKGASKTMDSEEVRALERMKDRTGLFLLAGSAADAVSYETTIYGQGLLTYALLFGMKGGALREGEFIDVLDLFQFAAKKVPQLAEDIGGIQRPEVRVPGDAESFDIGKMNEDNKKNIKLLSPKPVFVQTNFQHQNKFIDEENLAFNLDERLSELSRTSNAPIVYMNENKFGGAYQVRGRYEQKGGLTIVDVKVFQDDVLKSEFKVDGVSTSSLADKITARLMKVIETK